MQYIPTPNKRGVNVKRQRSIKKFPIVICANATKKALQSPQTSFGVRTISGHWYIVILPQFESNWMHACVMSQRSSQLF